MLLPQAVNILRFLHIWAGIKESELGPEEVGSHLSQVTFGSFLQFVLIDGNHVVRSGVTRSFFSIQQELASIRQLQSIFRP